MKSWMRLSMCLRRLWGYPATVAVIVGAVTFGPVLADARPAASAIPPYAIKVAGDREKGNFWSIWLFGKARSRGCWATRTGNPREIVTSNVTCGYAVPSRSYQLASMGQVGRPSETKSLFFFLVRSPTVQKLKLLTKRRGWISVRTHRIGETARRRARLPRGLGIAVKVLPWHSACLVHIVAVGRDGSHIAGGPIQSCA